MLLERVWAANDYRNFHYLIACPETGEALAVDPLDVAALPRCCARQGLADHAGAQHARARRPHRRQRRHGRGNRRKVLAHAGAAGRSAAWIAASAKVTSFGWARRGARMPRYAGPHDDATSASCAYRGACAFLRRYALQCRRRQLPQRRRSGCSTTPSHPDRGAFPIDARLSRA